MSSSLAIQEEDEPGDDQLISRSLGRLNAVAAATPASKPEQGKPPDDLELLEGGKSDSDEAANQIKTTTARMTTDRNLVSRNDRQNDLGSNLTIKLGRAVTR